MNPPSVEPDTGDAKVKRDNERVHRDEVPGTVVQIAYAGSYVDEMAGTSAPVRAHPRYVWDNTPLDERYYTSLAGEYPGYLGPRGWLVIEEDAVNLRAYTHSEGIVVFEDFIRQVEHPGGLFDSEEMDIIREICGRQRACGVPWSILWLIASGVNFLS